MRLKIVLGEENKYYTFPWGYSYYISSAIYNLLNRLSPRFADFLHNRGYYVGLKRFKLFTFSPFFARRFWTFKNICRMQAPLYFFFSSCVEEIVYIFMDALEREGSLLLIGFYLPVLYYEEIPFPKFDREMHFYTLSPLTLSLRPRCKGSKSEYLTPHSPGFKHRFQNNLITKYRVFKNVPWNSKDMDIKINVNWFKTKLIEIKNIKIKGILMDFEIAGPPEILRFGYESGFGEKTSLGFGMVKEK